MNEFCDVEHSFLFEVWPIECKISAANPAVGDKKNLAISLHVFLSLLQRVLQLEQSINSIGSKIDAVVKKLDMLERNKLKRKDLLGKPLDNVSKVGSLPPCIWTSFRVSDQSCYVNGPGIIFAFSVPIDINQKGLGRVSILYDQASSVQAEWQKASCFCVPPVVHGNLKYTFQLLWGRAHSCGSECNSLVLSFFAPTYPQRSKKIILAFPARTVHDSVVDCDLDIFPVD